MENEFRLQLLFNKYLQRQCTAKEVEELIALLQQADADNILNEQMQTLWKQLQEDNTQYPVDWDKMYNSISNTDADLSLVARRKYSPSKFWYSAVAIIILLFSGAAIYLYSTKDARNNIKPAMVNTIRPELSYNPKQIIHLPDGSTVILNTDSKLNYPSSFNGASREVYLVGEGYFDIKHNSKQPFFVHTGKITTKVLGTAFDIKAYPGDDNIQVTVTRGKVQVLKENKSIGFVTESQQLTFNKKTENQLQNIVDTIQIIAWKPQEFFFDNITMHEVAQQMQQRFGIEIYFANPSILNCRITATFSENDMPGEILAVICGVLKVSYTIENNKIMIDGKGCN